MTTTALTYAAAVDPATPPDVLGAIVTSSGDPEAIEAAAARPDAPMGVVVLWAAPGHHQDEWAQRGLARNPAAKPENLAALARIGSPQVRANVAANPVTGEGTLGELAQHPDATVRRAAVANPSTPAWARAAGGLLED